MFRTLSTLSCAALFITAADGASIMLEDFEDTNVNYTVSESEFYDGGKDHFTIVPLNGAATPDDGPYTGFGGSNFFSAEDIDHNGGSNTRTLTFNIDIAGATGLKFGGLFGAGANDAGGTFGFRYDDEDGLRITAQIDGGTVQNLLAFESQEPGGDTSNTLLTQDADFNGVGDVAGVALTSALQSFSDIDITGTGSNLVLTIEVTSSSGDEGLAFDNIEVTGDVVPEPSSTALLGLAGLCLLGRRSRA